MWHPVCFCIENVQKDMQQSCKGLTFGDWIKEGGGTEDFESYVCVCAHTCIFRVLYYHGSYSQIHVVGYLKLFLVIHCCKPML